MKIPLLLLLTAACALAQSESTIKVSTTIRPDGTRLDKEVNLPEHRSTETSYNEAGEVIQKSIFKTDDAGNPVTGTAFDAKGNPIMKVEYKRDSSNRVSEQIEFTVEGDLVRRLVYRYDSATGRLSGVDAFDGKGNPLK